MARRDLGAIFLRFAGALVAIARSLVGRTKFRALSPRRNPALNIQKRDRPAKESARKDEEEEE